MWLVTLALAAVVQRGWGVVEPGTLVAPGLIGLLLLADALTDIWPLISGVGPHWRVAHRHWVIVAAVLWRPSRRQGATRAEVEDAARGRSRPQQPLGKLPAISDRLVGPASPQCWRGRAHGWLCRCCPTSQGSVNVRHGFGGSRWAQFPSRQRSSLESHSPRPLVPPWRRMRRCRRPNDWRRALGLPGRRLGRRGRPACPGGTTVVRGKVQGLSRVAGCTWSACTPPATGTPRICSTRPCRCLSCPR